MFPERFFDFDVHLKNKVSNVKNDIINKLCTFYIAFLKLITIR